MTPVNVAAFVTRWHGALPPSQPNDSALLQSQSPGETAKKLNLQLQQRPELMRLAATPLLCAMICALHRERLETLPSARLKLYSECIDMLLNRRDAGRKIELDGSYPVGLDEAQKLELLQSLALKLMRANLSSLETERVDEHFGRELRNTNLPEEVKGEQIRALFVERAALLREPTVGQIDFAHRTFQEYLAAKAVLDDDSLEELLQKAADDQWREAIISATGLAGQKQRGKLLLSLIKQGNGNLASQARNKLISLAGKAANEEEVKNRKYLHLLAVACLETATSVDRGIRDHVLENARAIMPPQDDDEVAMVVRAGNEVVPLLTFESGYSGEEASRCIQALVAIGTSAAMEQLVAYATAEFESAQGSVAAALGKGWDIFNRDVYLEKVLCNSKTLNLSQTQVSDLSPLKALSQLQNLSLSQTQVSDLSPLKALSQLQSLYLSQTQVSDLSPLKALSQLQRLDLNQTQVSDLSPLKALSQLQILHLSQTQVNDLSPLKALSQLQGLYLSQTQVSDLSPLKALSQLQILHLNQTQVSDLSPLKELSQLQRLDLNQTQVSDLSPLKELSQLQILHLNQTQVSDLSPLKELSQLWQLYLNQTQVSDLSPLKELSQLWQLYLNQTQVSDLSSLKALSQLQILSVEQTKVTDRSPLKHLKNLIILPSE